MRKRFWCTLVVIISLGFGVYFGCRWYEHRNGGFTIEKITTQFSNDPSWEVPATSAQIAAANAMLQQPFYYLGQGFQCYAFVSQDGKYVLKFFRHQRLRPPVLYDWLPDTASIRALKEKKCQSRLERAMSLFQSFATAFQDVPEETGLIFVHLNKTLLLHPVVTLYDACGQKYTVTLDDREFLLQHKALHCKPVISALMEEGKLDEAMGRIDQIFDLLVTCAQKGIVDTDGALIKKNNLGFLADRAIYIDAGRIMRFGQTSCKQHFAKDVRRLRPLYKWLLSEYPPLARYFEIAQKRAKDRVSA